MISILQEGHPTLPLVRANLASTEIVLIPHAQSNMRIEGDYGFSLEFLAPTEEYSSTIVDKSRVDSVESGRVI